MTTGIRVTSVTIESRDTSVTTEIRETDVTIEGQTIFVVADPHDLL